MIYGLFEASIGIFLFIGLYTQLAAVFGMIALGIAWGIGLQEPIKPVKEIIWWLLLVLCLSITVMGAGPFAFDLPL